MRSVSLFLAATMLASLAAPVAVRAEAAAPAAPVKAPPTLETPNLPEAAAAASAIKIPAGDADDPAVWIHPTTPADSLVVTAVKDGGMRVYDLRGRLIQMVLPRRTEHGDGRINNVDVAYGLAFPDGSTADVAVASDRGLDVLRVFRIDGDATPLEEITAQPTKRAFKERPRDDGTGAVANPLTEQETVYGLALWKEPGGDVLVAVTQRHQPRIGLFRLVPKADGTVATEYVRDFRFPVRFKGQDLRLENDDDPSKDWSPQFEGLVVDQRTGILYAGQEDVGIWRVDLAAGQAATRPFYTTRGAVGSHFHVPQSRIARDVEGLTIYYGEDGGGYLLASSQGQAHGDARAPDAPYDDSFAVFDLDGKAIPRYRGSFRIGANSGEKIDAVQESDGAEVISWGLPGFPNGLFITQDGYDGDDFSGEVDSTNFKYVDWGRIARALKPQLDVTPGAYDPRNP